MLAAIFLVYSTALVLAGGYLYRERLFTYSIDRDLVLLRHTKNKVQDYFRRDDNPILSSIPLLSLNFKADAFNRLIRQRTQAKETQVLQLGAQDYVSGYLGHEGLNYEVRVRLKGDGPDHFARGSKWSFRIETKGSNTVLGMKRFSLQHPETREYLYEWLFQRLLDREGLLSVRYSFVRLTLNGQDLGIYALEEHFEKRLLEAKGRREGPIVRFSETQFWEITRQYFAISPQWPMWTATPTAWFKTTSGAFYAGEVDAFDTRKWLADPERRAMHEKAIHLLTAFREQKLPPHAVFDVDKIGRYFALADVYGTGHVRDWTDMRFYFNPITSRLEPIGFDAGGGVRVHIPAAFLGSGFLFPKDNFTPMKPDHAPFFDALADPGGPPYSDNLYREVLLLLFRDPYIQESYIRHLERMTVRSYLQSAFAELDGELQQLLRLLQTEWPDYEFTVDRFYQTQQAIALFLQPSKVLTAHYEGKKDGRLSLKVGNIQGLPIEVLGYSHGPYQIDFTEPEVLPGRIPLRSVAFHTLSATLNDEASAKELEPGSLRIRYRLLGSESIHEEPVLPWAHLRLDRLSEDIARRPPNVAQFDFLSVDEAQHVVRVKPGSWDITQDLIVPSGYTFACGPKTTLHLRQGASILSRSPLAFLGTPPQPIHIEGAQGGGLIVLEAGTLSTLSHVVFDSLSKGGGKASHITGAVTFYESPVKIVNCLFISPKAEDALNIIHSAFTIASCRFESAASDALDIDFSDGRIDDTLFYRCGNDAIDVSGATVTLEGVTIDGAGDKGISAGEITTLKGKEIKITKSHIAIACKDMSNVILDGVRISSSDIGFAVFQKKSEFGPAEMEITRAVLFETPEEAMVEEGSQLILNGTVIEARHRNLRSTFYEEE